LEMECRAMANYACKKGKSVPAEAIKIIESSQKQASDTDDLAHAHNILIKAVEPATPEAILLLGGEPPASRPWQFLGSVTLVRHMMFVACISLLLFIGLALSADVNKDAGKILETSGVHLLIPLFFFVSAASIGACFAALYKANAYITNGTFDPTY